MGKASRNCRAAASGKHDWLRRGRCWTATLSALAEWGQMKKKMNNHPYSGCATQTLMMFSWLGMSPYSHLMAHK